MLGLDDILRKLRSCSVCESALALSQCTPLSEFLVGKNELTVPDSEPLTQPSIICVVFLSDRHFTACKGAFKVFVLLIG